MGRLSGPKTALIPQECLVVCIYIDEISYLRKYGKVAERFKAAVLKTADGESCP